MINDLNGFFPGIEEKDLLEGTMKKVSVEGEPILFIKKNAKIYVIDNRCPHQGCGFSGGCLDGVGVVCPCHEWRFNLDTGEYDQDPSFKLKTFEWKIVSGKIWVKLDDF